MKAVYSGKEMTIRLNGKRTAFLLTRTTPALKTADGLQFVTADNKVFLLKQEN